MKPINLCTLEVRVGKCNLNLKSDGFFGVSLQMGRNVSSMSPIKKIQSNIVSFNTTLRMNVEKQLIQQQSTANFRILLHLVRQNRQKKVIGIATVDIIRENNQGFKYHQFGQCADCEADIQVSITYGNSFQLGVRSEIGYFQTNESAINQGNDLEQSRGRKSIAEDSILDNSDYNILKQSKAVSYIDNYTINRPKRQSMRLKPRRTKDIEKLRKTKPQNFSSCAPQQIITHYETEIRTFQQELKQREDWANGMKQLIQQLEAENQLLKQITVEELEAYNVPNFQQGIEVVSKLVHSKFQASRSMIYESPKSEDRIKQQPSEHQRSRNILEQNQQQSEQQNEDAPGRSLTQTKSYKGLPDVQLSPRIQNSPQKSEIQQRMTALQSLEQLQNALKILTGEQKSSDVMLQNVKISQLEEEMFKLRQEKQELYDMTEELYSESKKIKLQRDSFYKDVKSLQQQLERMEQYIDQIKAENSKLKDENQKYENNSKTEEIQRLINENESLLDKSKELERQLKESLKAIEEFKNDALNARQELIMKDDQLSNYKLKFGELGSMTDVLLNNLRLTPLETSGQKKLNKTSDHPACEQTTSATSSRQNLHSLYTHLLETSVTQRRQLHHSLSQIITSKTESSLTPLNSQKKEQNLKRLQTQINRMFIELFKNNSDIKNLKELQKAKFEVTKQIQELISTV